MPRNWWEPEDEEEEDDSSSGDSGWGGPGGWDSGDTGGSDEPSDTGDTGWGGPGGWDSGGSSGSSGGDNDDDGSSSGGGGSNWWDSPSRPAADAWGAARTVANTVGRSRAELGGQSWEDLSPESFMSAVRDRPSRPRRPSSMPEDQEQRDILAEIAPTGTVSAVDTTRAIQDVIPPDDLQARALAARARAVRPGGNIVDNVLSTAQDMIQRAIEDTEGKKALQLLALEDWQRESGRKTPNVNDPRDVANFKQYVEDWVGRAKDFNDQAGGMDAMEKLRTKAIAGAQKAVMDAEQRPAAGQPASQQATTTAPGMASATTAAGRDRYFDERIQQRGGVAPAGGPSYSLGDEPLPVSTSLTSKAMASGMDVLDAATVALLAAQQGSNQLVNPGDDSQAKFHLASAISSGEPWAEPALQTIAQMAWWQESGGQEGPPEMAPPSFVRDWISAWRAGEKVPLADNLNRQLREQGVYAPGSPLGPDWRRTLIDVDQGKLITDPRYRQMMSTTITVAEAGAICGPIAAMAFAKATGRTDMTLDEAKRLGAAVGWNVNRGMAGITSQLALVEKMGVPAEIGQATTPRMAAAVEDAPVIVSTGAHYFVATEYNPQNGRFFVGATGRALSSYGGGDWMSIAEMDNAARRLDARNGGVNGAIYMTGGAGAGGAQPQQMQAMSAPEPQQPTTVAQQSAVAGGEGLGAIPVEPLRPVILQSAQTNQLDPALIAAQIDQESTWRQDAGSSAGAQGYLQLMPETARSLGVTSIRDPQQNIMAGGKYLRQMIDRYGGDVELGLAAYNAGPGNVDSAIRRAGASNFEAAKRFLPGETQQYVPLVMGKRQQYVAQR